MQLAIRDEKLQPIEVAAIIAIGRPQTTASTLYNHHATMMAEILIAVSCSFILGGEGVAKPNQCLLHRNVVHGLVSGSLQAALLH